MQATTKIKKSAIEGIRLRRDDQSSYMLSGLLDVTEPKYLRSS